MPTNCQKAFMHAYNAVNDSFSICLPQYTYKMVITPAIYTVLVALQDYPNVDTHISFEAIVLLQSSLCGISYL